MKSLPIAVALSLLLPAALPPAHAGDYQGAAAILKQVAPQASEASDPTRKSTSLRQWHEDIKNYRARAASLSPAEIAEAWLALFDRAVKLPGSQDGMRYVGGSQSPRLLEVLAILPPPAAWDALTSQVAARPLPEKGSTDCTTLVLRVITGTLQNQPETVRHAIDALKQQADDLDESRSGDLRQRVQGLQEIFFTFVGDKQSILAQFEGQLKRLQSAADSSSTDSEIEMLRMNSLEVPDLLSLTDAARAETLLKMVFATEVRDVTIRSSKTKALARKLALEMGDRLKFAPWSLVDNLESTRLYELLDKRFPRRPNDMSERSQADSYYLLGLIVGGRDDEAAKMAINLSKNSRRDQEDTLSSLSESTMADLAQRGYAKEIYRFFDRLLASHPDLSYWHSYTTAAVLAGETDAMLARVKAASDRVALSPRAKSGLRRVYGSALLAADHVAEALPILREQAGTMLVSARDGGSDVSSERREGVVAASNLAEIGQLLGDEALVNEQLDLVVNAAKTQPGIIDNESLTEIFVAAKRGPELERMLAASLAQATRVAAALALQENRYVEFDEDNVAATLTPLLKLTDLYYQVDRYEDIVALLDQAKAGARRTWPSCSLPATMSPAANLAIRPPALCKKPVIQTRRCASSMPSSTATAAAIPRTRCCWNCYLPTKLKPGSTSFSKAISSRNAH